MTVQNIGIVNAFGANRGDEAMLGVLIENLLNTQRARNVTVYTQHWVDLARFGVKLRSWLAPREV